jgi:hypothetical protein
LVSSAFFAINNPQKQVKQAAHKRFIQKQGLKGLFGVTTLFWECWHVYG